VQSCRQNRLPPTPFSGLRHAPFEQQPKSISVQIRVGIFGESA
jgi:hypothetical protein